MRLRALTAALAAVLVVPLVSSTSPVAQAAPGDVLLSENFDSGTMPAGWTAVSGAWSVRDGRLVVDGGAISRLTFGKHWQNYRFEATVRFEKVANVSRWTGLMLDVQPDGAAPWWHAVMRSQSTAANGVEIATRTASNTWSVPYAGSAPSDAGVGRDVQLKAEVQGAKTTWYFDGIKVLEGRIDRTATGVLGFVADGSTVSFDNVKVTEIEPEKLVVGDGKLPVTIAHRGYSQVNPENTLAALVAGSRSGAEYIETDVHTSADGVPVVMHDQTVNRTTDGAGDVALLMAGYILGLDAGTWFDLAFAGQKTPSLAQVLDVTKRGRSQLLLEIKGPETDVEVARIVKMVQDAKLVDKVVIQSFDTNVLVSAKKHAPEIRLGLLRGSLDADPVAVSKQYGVVAYNPSFGALRSRPSIVADLHAAGVAVMPWTIDAPQDWKAAADWDVDGIITNRPGALIGWKSAIEAIPAPAKPTVAIVSPADGAKIERGADVVIAAAATGSDAIALTLDGKPVTQGAVIPAADLALGAHTVVATATSPGGTAEALSTFQIVVTATGLRSRLAALDVSIGQLQQLLTALDNKDWDGLARVVRKHVRDAAIRDRLLAEIAAVEQ